jgi:hypothetical protein
MWKMRNTYKILAGRPAGKRLLVTFQCKWEDTFKIDNKCDRKLWMEFNQSF